MAKDKQNDTSDPMLNPGFPPSEKPENAEETGGPIASAAETTPSGGLIGDATSTYQNLSDCE